MMSLPLWKKSNHYVKEAESLKKQISYILTAALAAILLCSCSRKAASYEPTERIPGDEVFYTGTDYVMIGEGDNIELLLHPETGNIRWQDKRTGEYFETKLFDSGYTDSSMLSDVAVTYYNGSESNKYNSYSSMDSYNYGVLRQTMTYEAIDNGIRIVYHLSSDSLTYKDFPSYLSNERMEEMVMQYLDTSQRKIIEKQYRQLKTGIWLRNSSKDSPLSGMAIQELYSLFYEVGTYTFDDLQDDYDEYDVASVDRTSRQAVKITIEYYLDGDDLMVRIPTGEIVYNIDDYPIRTLEVLPYFMSSSESDGYIFVPDGSGALIYLDNDKKSEYQFSARYYGGDILQENDYKSYDIYMTCPVYGIKVGDKAVLGIIEKGSEKATLKSYISGYYSGIPYSRAALSFAIREDQVVADYSNNSSPFILRKVSDDHYTDDILIRYCYLAGKDADYTGMAKAYQNYLLKCDALAANEPEDEAPLFIELYGLIDKKQYKLGIPYNGKQNLTTFLEAKTILGELNDQGISNMIVEYNGILNGGLNQRSVKSVKLESRLGGTKGFNSLLEYAQSIGAEIYPVVQLQTAAQTISTSNKLSKKERSYQINGALAQISTKDIITKVLKTGAYSKYIINPIYMPEYMTAFSKSYKKLGTKNLSSHDFLSFIGANYKNKQNLSMTNAISYYMEALDILDEGYNLLLSNPIYLAYGKVTYITDLPTKNSTLKSLDVSVPFVQLVLDGHITYSSEKLNTNSHDLAKKVMKAIETRSALKFTLMASETLVLRDTEARDNFLVRYTEWMELIGKYYAQYNEFYQKVNDAVIVNHEFSDRNFDHTIVTYSNGITVYLNYGDVDAVINGVAVPAISYCIK